MKGGIDLAGGEKGSDHAWLMDQTRPSIGRPLGTNRGTAFHSFPLSPHPLGLSQWTEHRHQQSHQQPISQERIRQEPIIG